MAIFLLMTSALLAQSQQQSSSDEGSSPLMMFSFFGKAKPSERRSDQADQVRRPADRQDLSSRASEENSSSLFPRRNFSLGPRESNNDLAKEDIELVTFPSRNVTVASSSVMKNERALQEERSRGLNTTLQSFILSLPAGDRLHQLGEDPKLITVFNKYKNLFFATYEKRERLLLLALCYEAILTDCHHGLDAGRNAAAAPAGSFERNAWNNLVTTTKKLLSFKIPLIAADVASNSRELRRLVPLIKNYEDVADLRVQIIHAFKKGKTDLVQRLVASDPSEIIEKIEAYQSLRRVARSRNGWLASAYKKIIKTYQEMLKSRQESARTLSQGAVYPEVSQAWINVEKSYLMLIDWYPIESEFFQMEPNHTWAFSYSFKNIADTYKQAIHYRISAARAAAIGRLEEVGHCSEAATVCEKLTDIKNSIPAPAWNQLLLRFGDLAVALRKLADHQLKLNKLLSPEVDGVRSWKHQELSHFNKQLKIVFPNLCKKVPDTAGQENLRRHLLHELEVAQKEVEARTNALGGDTEYAPELQERLNRLWTQAANSYYNYGYYKNKFYDVRDTVFFSEDNHSKYWLKFSEYSEQEGECYVKAIEILKTDHENREEVSRRWLDIASFRNLMRLEHGDEILNRSDVSLSLFRTWERCEEIINLKTQAIEGVLRGDPVERIAALDHEIQRRESAARTKLDQIKEVAGDMYYERTKRYDGP